MGAHNVLPKLPPPSSQLWRSRRQIRDDLEAFFGIDGDEPIELWAWVAAYDHVVLCQLWGTMTDLPPSMPAVHPRTAAVLGGRGSPALPRGPGEAHDALADARHNCVKFEAIDGRRRLGASA